MIHARCPECGTVLQVSYGQRGRRVRCPACQARFSVEDTALSGAEQAQAKEKTPRKKRRERKIARPLKPYEQIDESVLARIPEHHRLRNVCLILGGIVVLGVAVFLCGKLIHLGNKAGEPVEWPLPMYGEKLHEHIQSAGYFAEKGAVTGDDERYHCRLGGRLPIYFYAFADGAENVSLSFYACGRLRLQGTLEQEEAQKVLCGVMGEYLAELDRAPFSQWVWTTFPKCWRALSESKKFADEKQFGDMLVRLDHCDLYGLGTGVAVSVKRAKD